MYNEKHLPDTLWANGISLDGQIVDMDTLGQMACFVLQTLVLSEKNILFYSANL